MGGMWDKAGTLDSRRKRHYIQSKVSKDKNALSVATIIKETL